MRSISPFCSQIPINRDGSTPKLAQRSPSAVPHRLLLVGTNMGLKPPRFHVRIILQPRTEPGWQCRFCCISSATAAQRFWDR
jgi:hypothetical protein